MSPPMTQADQQTDLDRLISRIAEQDRQAFAELFAFMAPKVKGYLRRLGNRDEEAEELTQDVMLSVWRKAALFDPGKSSAQTWIFVIARNRRIDSLRREKAIVSYPEHFPDAPDENVIPADQRVAGAQRDARVRQAMVTLPPDQQDVIRRSFFEELPHSAIAEALGLPLGTVKSRLRLAFEKLRERLEDLAQ